MKLPYLLSTSHYAPSPFGAGGRTSTAPLEHLATDHWVVERGHGVLPVGGQQISPVVDDRGPTGGRELSPVLTACLSWVLPGVGEKQLMRADAVAAEVAVDRG